MIRVGIIGASGYTSRELVRILLGHPDVKITVATTTQTDRPRLDALHPSLASRIDLECEPFDADKIASRADVVFLGLPHTASMAVTPALRQRNVRVIDLSADYRLTDPTVYADWYGHTHSDLAGLQEAVYGLPELFRDQIRGRGLIANPGCYTSASILGLAPLVRADLIENVGIIIDAKSGVSGAGRSPKLTTHYPECNESLSAYSVGQHRHTPEIDQVLSGIRADGAPKVEVIFTPHLVPMDRGIHATIYANPKRHVTEHDLMDLFRSTYQSSPFVRIVKGLPSTKDSSFTNFVDITVRVVRGKIIIFSALDNLLKGASGVAVQNFNLITGHPEMTALC